MSAGRRAVRIANRVNVLAARSRSEWTASLKMPRLPVSRPTMSLAITRTTPMKTEPSATSSGRRARDLTEPTVAGAFLFQERRRGEELRLGAESDEQVALLEAQVGARAHEQRAVPASERQHPGCRRIEQPGLRDRLADGRHARPYEQLLDPDARLAVVERVQHVDQRRAHGQLCHAMAGHLIRRDRPGRAGELETADRFWAPRPRDDVQVRVEGPGGQDDVDGPLVRGDRRDQAPGTLDPRLLEKVLARGVAFEVKAPLGAKAADGFLGLVDHRIRDLVIL